MPGSLSTRRARARLSLLGIRILKLPPSFFPFAFLANIGAMGKLKPEGMVLGIDVGYSDTSPSTCFCRLEWTRSRVSFDFRLTTASDSGRATALDSLCDGRTATGVALDGPLTRDLRLVPHYRAAESILSRGVLQKRGKPGQTSAPVGQQLHSHATKLAGLVLSRVDVEHASHEDAVDARRVVEAFPNIYLAALIDEQSLKPVHRNASDVYWNTVANETTVLRRHIQRLLPGRQLNFDCGSLTHHDHRAGVICALTALTVAQGSHVAVGDPSDGDIMLPPRREWARSSSGKGSWLEPVLRKNLFAVVDSSREWHAQARIIDAADTW
jgi:hypothetical protein